MKTIFYQDIVSVCGSAVALVGIGLVWETGDFVVDGIAASGVGAILIGTGFVLASETREFLVGRAISSEAARRIVAIIERDPRVRRVRSLQSMMLGPDDALIAAKVNFQDGLNTDQIESAIDQLSLTMRQAAPGLRHIIIEPES